MALILAATAPGHLKAAKKTALLTMEETVEAMKKAGLSQPFGSSTHPPPSQRPAWGAAL